MELMDVIFFVIGLVIGFGVIKFAAFCYDYSQDIRK